MNPPSNSSLWAKVVQMARDGLDATAAFRTIRAAGGRDLTKDDDEFKRVYERFVKQPLFARNMILTLRRSELQEDVISAMLSVDVDADDQVDGVLTVMQEFEKGSMHAMLQCFDRVRAVKPDLADQLLATARELWPAVFARMDAQEAQNAAARDAEPTQLELPLSAQPEQHPAVPVVPA